MFPSKFAWVCTIAVALAGPLARLASHEPHIPPVLPETPTPAAPVAATETQDDGEASEALNTLTPYDKLFIRLEEAERKLQLLEREPGVPAADDKPGVGRFFHGLMLVHDPEVAAAREQMAVERQRIELPPEAVDAAGTPRASKAREPRWYEKLSIRGYTQFRLNEVTALEPDSAPAQHPGDGSVGTDRNFLIRRARLIISGNVTDHMFIYFQNDFASSVSGATNGVIQFTQIRDWYADLFIDKTQVHRIRVGQSKVPYGWENLQSSSNRIPLDRNDAFNSEVRNERDLGVFYYWTPVYAQKLFRYVLAEGLKGSGNYGVFGVGVYNGQGGSFAEQNENVHVVARLALPFQLPNGQIMEFDVQALTGKYDTFSAAILPLGRLPAAVPRNTLNAAFPFINRAGIRDERLGWSYILYPQPIGFQAEWTIGRGPSLNDAQTAVQERALYGGYIMALAKIDTSTCGLFYPYIRYQKYKGGYKPEVNSPYAHIEEYDMGVEWQINPAMEFTMSYVVTDRTNTVAPSTTVIPGQPPAIPYQEFDGQLLRFQFQVNY